jgi:site-specific DNA recombinase
MEQKKRVGIWIRVSTDHQVRDESPEHHEQRARYYANLKDWDVVELYQLGAFSGKAISEHPETRRMLADIRRGHITGLVFSKLARLARNTKELLDFAEIFRQSNADLISLAESIDTSTPAGRLFFTIIAAMAQWEREEIASRVAASVPIRARLGKSLGGQAPLGYRWKDNRFEISEAEAPVRREMYELFMQCQRKHTVANTLNARGYRTRNGSKFTATTVERLLRDSTAKGERRANYTQSAGKNKGWTVKPESEWVVTPCPAIVSPELWNSVNTILTSQERQNTRVGKKAAYLLSGFVKCGCKKSMYVQHKSKTYGCAKCKTRIRVADIDDIYQTYLKEYLASINIEAIRQDSDSQLREKRQLLSVLTKERARLAKRINELIELRLDGGLSKDRYAEQYAPIEEKIQQIDAQTPKLEAEIDVYEIHALSGEVVVKEAQTLFDQWEQFDLEQRRLIVETITTSIEVGKEDIVINLAYAPAHSLNGKNTSPHDKGSYW